MSEDTHELGESADEISERKIRPQVEVGEEAHEYVAIDPESEDFEINADQRAASDRLLRRHPEARGPIWFRRIGNRITITSGGLREEDAE